MGLKPKPHTDSTVRAQRLEPSGEREPHRRRLDGMEMTVGDALGRRRVRVQGGAVGNPPAEDPESYMAGQTGDGGLSLAVPPLPSPGCIGSQPSWWTSSRVAKRTTQWYPCRCREPHVSRPPCEPLPWKGLRPWCGRMPTSAGGSGLSNTSAATSAACRRKAAARVAQGRA